MDAELGCKLIQAHAPALVLVHESLDLGFGQPNLVLLGRSCPGSLTRSARLSLSSVDEPGETVSELSVRKQSRHLQVTRPESLRAPS
jgi:hypothetical protein